MRSGGAQGSEEMELELVLALPEGRLPLYYQPCVDLRDGRVVAVEALLRLVGRDGVLVPPSEFIPVAERTGLIVPIGADVIARSVAQAAEWREKFGRPVRVWINLAAPQLAEVEAVVRVVVDALERHHATPDLIGLEVTESMLMENIDSAVDGLRTLRRLGVEIALDDFRTGHSSLSDLRQLPVTVVKVDRSFVSGIGGSLADAAIVEAVIELAHTLGLAVVAEGAETVPQVRELQALGAERAQGFLCSRPTRPRELEPSCRSRGAGSTASAPCWSTTVPTGSRAPAGRGPGSCSRRSTPSPTPSR
jgi:EAL domain-containing protein (putative c-di-GMP-specific phosphodiesterase class I)